MKITFDSDAEASYIYFTSIEPGGVFETFVDLRLDVEFDKDEMIAAMRLLGGEGCRLQGRLKYALRCPQTTFDEKTNSILIAFTIKSTPTKIVSWEANVDVDKEGQILGLEILFAGPDYEPDDGRERLYAKGRL
ncbi:MAG: DUF2283 domain-containing protein, partial [Blastocatellia bacterium]|nr:DUF2283 domain-containing protein [Blastocatellia bacterium]